MTSVTFDNRVTAVNSNSIRPNELARFYRGLGDPTRIKILNILSNGEQSVSSLVSLLKAPQGRVSSHLACLRWCGFVVTERRGRSVYYSIGDPHIVSLLALGESIFTSAAERILACDIIEETERV
jgi:DNA-binding transcriptional ArsR family regulator